MIEKAHQIRAQLLSRQGIQAQQGKGAAGLQQAGLKTAAMARAPLALSSAQVSVR